MTKDRDQLLVMIKVIAPSGSADNLIAVIKPIMGSIRARGGCLHCHIYQDGQNPEEMALLQEWADKNAFAAHVGSRDYRYILEWMEMSAEKPEVTICKNPDHKGFKVIKDLLEIAGSQTGSSMGADRRHPGKPS